MTMQAAFLSGQRLHLQHGPIDLVIGAFGDDREVARAYELARDCFQPILADLAAQLPVLRSAARPDLTVEGTVAQAMLRAVLPHASDFITPMAAVAGAVADHVLATMTTGTDLARAYVNNGGDIALFLAPGEVFRIGIMGIETGAMDGMTQIRAEQHIRGIATSGRGGRSFSLGIADSVTVLAATAAQADAAATMIANAVDLPGHPAIHRRPASALSPDSDLGERLVTVSVDALSPDDCRNAIAAGAARAHLLLQQGLIEGAKLSLQGIVETVGGTAELTSVGGHSEKA